MKTVAATRAAILGITLLVVLSSRAQGLTGGSEPLATVRQPLFPTSDAALALVGRLGLKWQQYTRFEDIQSASVAIRRYYFAADTRFVNLYLAPDGSVFEFYLYAGPAKPGSVSDRCTLLPAPSETARILLAVVEPNHTVADEKTVAGSAILGWDPLLSIKNARVLRTRIRFTSYNKACQISMRRDWL